MNTSNTAFRLLVALCAFAGLRRGEVMALQVEDFDNTKNILTVRRQIQFPPGQKSEVRAPKYGSERSITLAEELAAMLFSHILNLSSSEGDGTWVFPGHMGNPIHTRTLYTWWYKAKRDTGVTGIRLHDLRHFFASGLIASGCDVVAVQRALGHANAAMTLGTYAHLWPRSEDRTRSAAAAMLAEVLDAS